MCTHNVSSFRLAEIKRNGRQMRPEDQLQNVEQRPHLEATTSAVSAGMVVAEEVVEVLEGQHPPEECERGVESSRRRRILTPSSMHS